MGSTAATRWKPKEAVPNFKGRYAQGDGPAFALSGSARPHSNA